MNRLQCKEAAKNSVAGYIPNVYYTALVFFVITTILEIVGSRISSIVTDWTRSALYYLEAFNVLPQYSGREWIATVFVWAISILEQLIQVGFMSYCLLISRHQRASIYDLGNGFALTWKVFLIMLVTGFFVFLWSLLFVIPGIIAAYRYRLAYFILLDSPEKGVMQCIRESKELMHGYKAELFILDISFIGWYLLIFITFGILAIWKGPYINTTYAIFYNNIAYPAGIMPNLEDTEEENTEDNNTTDGL